MTTYNALQWRKSTFSSIGDCVGLAQVNENTLAVCNTNDPARKLLLFSPHAMAGWLAGIKAGEFDDFA